MADTVDVKVIQDGKRYYVVHLQNYSDGTGESGVTKVDISTLTASSGLPCSYTRIDNIVGNVWGGTARLYWDHTTDDEIATIQGTVNLDWSWEGGNTDPKTTGGTGDILLTTGGFVSGSGYDLTIRLVKKA
jgi:hypothetical protein